MRVSLACDCDSSDIVYRQLRRHVRRQEATIAAHQGIEQRGGELHQVRQFTSYACTDDRETNRRREFIKQAEAEEKSKAKH